MDIFKEKESGLSIGLDRISKGGLNDIASSVISNVMEGNVDALHEYIKAKALAELSSIIVEGLKSEAMSEADNYHKDETVLGCTIAIKGTPAIYDFSTDPEWVIIQEKISTLKKEAKIREDKMIDALKYSNVVDENGEEIVKPLIKKESGTTLSITIGK